MSRFTRRIPQQPRRPQLAQQQNQLFTIKIVLLTVLMGDVFGHMIFWDRRNASVRMIHRFTMQPKRHARLNQRKSAHSIPKPYLS